MSTIYGDRWKILGSVGEGGQAHTFLVSDAKGEGEYQYLLKRLKNVNRVERFKREVEAVRNLSHPNIVQLVDFDLTTGKGHRPYLVTEYCSGGSLAKAEPFWRDSSIVALEIFQEICEGVSFAHNEGITHRDLKPDNILLRSEDGPAVVGDFGICYLEEDGTRLTITEEAVGPVYYMAPELEEGRIDKVSPSSDIYSLGKLLYWLLSGRIFSREKHRDPEWDLKGPKKWSGRNAAEEFWENIYMEHVNRLLDRMIIPEPEKRIDVHQVLLLISDIKRLVSKEFNPIAKDIQQPCTYCGYGHYRVREPSPEQTKNLVRTFIGGGFNWRVLDCDTCGHIQIFRIDEAREKDWWG